MSHITNIMKKELKEMLTPGSVISVIVMVILFAGLGGLINEEVQKSIALPVIGIANFDDQIVDTPNSQWNAYDTLEAIYINNGIPASQLDKYIIKMTDTDLDKQLLESGASLALVLDKNFKKDVESRTPGKIYQYFVYEPKGMISGTVSSTVSSTIISFMESDLSNKLMVSEEEKKTVKFLIDPINGDNTYTYINGERYEDVTPAEIASALSGQTMFVPIIIMIIIMMVGSILISSMGSEKENKTLETLLTLPIKRTTIVTGKILAAAIVGLVFGLAYMVGMGFYIGSISGMGTTAAGIDLSEYGLVLTGADFALVMLSMFLSICCALGICMILGAFAKNYKSAQTMTMPLSILAIIPMFIIMFSGWYGANGVLQAIIFAIPFSHPMMAMEALMNGDVSLVLSGIVYMMVFATIAILITVRLYRSDILITGLSQNRYVEMLRSGSRRKK